MTLAPSFSDTDGVCGSPFSRLSQLRSLGGDWAFNAYTRDTSSDTAR